MNFRLADETGFARRQRTGLGLLLPAEFPVPGLARWRELRYASALLTPRPLESPRTRPSSRTRRAIM